MRGAFYLYALAKPALGKAKFEMLAFAVTVINGCESCVKSHEDALRKHEVSVDKIHDLARMAAVVRGIQALSVKGQSFRQGTDKQTQFPYPLHSLPKHHHRDVA